ncbi:MAG TPA: nuclear transport factor 2 family protein [Burkholderiaceae bacterium]
MLAAVELYFQALHECDLGKFDQVFHPAASLFDSLDGRVTAMPVAAYREVIAQRRPPAAAGQPREDALLALDLLSPQAAVAKVRLRIHEHVFVDHLQLMRQGERFVIVAKAWHEQT